MSDRIVFYGSLLRSNPTQQQLGVAARLRFLGSCRVAGRLIDLGSYPGYLPGEGEVHGELYEPLDDRVLDVIDEFEEFDVGRMEQSLYLRRKLPLIEPDGAAWVYVYNRSVEGCPLIESGCWESYRRGLKFAAERRS